MSTLQLDYAKKFKPIMKKRSEKNQSNYYKIARLGFYFKKFSF